MTDWEPIAVGGLGGSGTRVIAAILQEAGIYIGGDLNESLDNLWFTLLFKYRGILEMPETEFCRLVEIFVASMSGDHRATPLDLRIADELAAHDRIQHDAEWLAARAASLRQAVVRPTRATFWGWKEPNTHIVIDRLNAAIPRLKYIHVARNGLDMAHSANKNQLQLWGSIVLDGDSAPTPANALRFWRWAHSRIAQLDERMKPRLLLVRFEDLCADPKTEIAKILSFASIRVDAALLDRTIALVTPPPSFDRHRAWSLDNFDPADVAFVRDFGFYVG